MAKKRKIALVIGQLGFGGGEGQLCQLAQGLSARGCFEPRVYCLSDRTTPYGQYLRRSGIRVTEISAPIDLLKALALARHLRFEGIELAHSFLYIANRYCLLATRLLRGCTLITSARNCKRDPGILRLLNRASFNASRAIICNSQAVARYVTQEYDAPREKITVVYNGVDSARFYPRAGWAPSSNGRPPVIGTVGRIEVQKNLPLFLQAAAELKRKMGNCRFVIAGNGSQMEKITELAISLGIGDAVKFLGARQDVPELIRNFDVFWLTSDWEGTPNVVLEAMASGVPVVATAVGGCDEILDDGETGFLISRGNAGELVERTEMLLRNREKAREIGGKALQTVTQRFNVSAMVETVVALYQRLA